MSGQTADTIVAPATTPTSQLSPDRNDRRVQYPRSRWLTLPRPMLLLPVAVVAVMLVCALAPGAIAPFDPTDMDSDAVLHAPGVVHWLGTDNLGRDVLSLLIYGARASLLMGACAVGLGGVAGGLIGLIAGFAGRAVDMTLMRLLDVWMSVPDILLAIVIAAAGGQSG
jgi:peptide/nickel transport system permease protein